MSTVTGSQRAENLSNLYAHRDTEDYGHEHCDDTEDVKGSEIKLGDNKDEDFDQFMRHSPEEKVSPHVFLHALALLTKMGSPYTT